MSKKKDRGGGQHRSSGPSGSPSETPQLTASAPAAPPLLDQTRELLKQLVEVVGRLGDELSPGRIASAVEKQVGVSPGVIQEAVQSHRELAAR